METSAGSTNCSKAITERYTPANSMNSKTWEGFAIGCDKTFIHAIRLIAGVK